MLLVLSVNINIYICIIRYLVYDYFPVARVEMARSPPVHAEASSIELVIYSSFSTALL